MSKWWEFTRRTDSGRFRVRYGKKRFYTSRDMSELKRMESVSNAEAKRGERDKKHEYISVCGCGSEGCFILSHRRNFDSEYSFKSLK
jgi:hypothetical protein